MATDSRQTIAGSLSEYNNWKHDRSRRKLSLGTKIAKSVDADDSSTKNEEQAVRLLDCTVCGNKVAREPVVTSCGHLFCWECLYQWYNTSQTCPECRAELTSNKIIPLYSRGSARKSDDIIPQRPRPPVVRRTESVDRQLGNHHHRNHHHGSHMLPMVLNCYAISWQPRHLVYRIGWEQR